MATGRYPNKKKAPVGKPKPRGRPQKNPIEVCIEILIEPDIVGEEEVAMSITKTTSKIYEPGLYDKAINNPVHGRRWREAIKKKLQNLESHQTWEYEEFPPGQKAMRLKWVFKVKYYPDGSIARFKARLIVQGFSQVPDIDICKTFAPTVRREFYLTLCLALNFFIYQVDIVAAYLESLLNDNELPIFMKLPPGVHKFRQI